MDLATADIQHRLDKVEAEIDRLKLLVERQAISANELPWTSGLASSWACGA